MDRIIQSLKDLLVSVAFQNGIYAADIQGALAVVDGESKVAGIKKLRSARLDSQSQAMVEALRLKGFSITAPELPCRCGPADAKDIIDAACALRVYTSRIWMKRSLGSRTLTPPLPTMTNNLKPLPGKSSGVY